MLGGPVEQGLAQPALGALNALSTSPQGSFSGHGQLQPGLTELVNIDRLYELCNRAIDRFNNAEGQQGDRL